MFACLKALKQGMSNEKEETNRQRWKTPNIFWSFMCKITLCLIYIENVCSFNRSWVLSRIRGMSEQLLARLKNKQNQNRSEKMYSQIRRKTEKQQHTSAFGGSPSSCESSSSIFFHLKKTNRRKSLCVIVSLFFFLLVSISVPWRIK